MRVARELQQLFVRELCAGLLHAPEQVAAPPRLLVLPVRRGAVQHERGLLQYVRRARVLRQADERALVPPVARHPRVELQR